MALIIEYSVIVRCVYFQILTARNFDIVSVEDEYEALEPLQTDNDFDFIVIDAGTNDMNGEEVFLPFLLYCLFANWIKFYFF